MAFLASMATSPHMRPISAPIFLLLLFSAASASSAHLVAPPGGDASPAVQAALREYGFPIGLIPGTVVSYDLQANNGRFQVLLEDDGCRFTIPTAGGNRAYPVSYSSSISGTIAKGSIADLRGVSVSVFRRWWPISGIRSVSDGRRVAFDIGTLSVDYPAANFDDVPVCDDDGARGKGNRAATSSRQTS